ncbi:hypothetical protein SDC9_116237 [bioreactor metagenome]|uniref:Uncharacterized protein n=1 Tax=bioreactor metagenome TaxID=1076179 RepID=A0A645C1R8_9ZZZZ
MKVETGQPLAVGFQAHPQTASSPGSAVSDAEVLRRASGGPACLCLRRRPANRYGVRQCNMRVDIRTDCQIGYCRALRRRPLRARLYRSVCHAVVAGRRANTCRCRAEGQSFRLALHRQTPPQTPPQAARHSPHAQKTVAFCRPQRCVQSIP